MILPMRSYSNNVSLFPSPVPVASMSGAWTNLGLFGEGEHGECDSGMTVLRVLLEAVVDYGVEGGAARTW